LERRCLRKGRIIAGGEERGKFPGNVEGSARRGANGVAGQESERIDGASAEPAGDTGDRGAGGRSMILNGFGELHRQRGFRRVGPEGGRGAVDELLRDDRCRGWRGDRDRFQGADANVRAGEQIFARNRLIHEAHHFGDHVARHIPRSNRGGDGESEEIGRAQQDFPGQRLVDHVSRLDARHVLQDA
jgi:hypothetical protein